MLNKTDFKSFDWSEDDVNFLYLIRNDKLFLKFCTKRNYTVDFECFRDELRKDFEDDRCDQYIIVNFENKKIGTVYSYSFNGFDNSVFFSIFLVKNYQNYGYGVSAVLGFLKLIFKKYNLEKVFFDVYEHNISVINMILRLQNVFLKVNNYMSEKEICYQKCYVQRFMASKKSLYWLLDFK